MDGRTQHVTPAVASGHLKQLDALRAFAVLAVMTHHYVSPDSHITGYGAAAGVRLFFALSGFLITGILLRSRDAVETGQQTQPAAILRFYARRFLRIFPLYYLVIGVAFAADVEPVRRLIRTLLTYTFNIHMARQGWYEANFAHFWSLSVEEQFYFVWPWLVLLSPRRLLVPLTVTMTALGPLYRLSYIWSDYQNMTALSAYISTWTCLDALGMGSLLAIARRSTSRPQIERYLERMALPIALVVIAAVLTVGGASYLLLHDVAQAVIFCWLISRAAVGFRGPIGRLLEWQPIVYIGTISYGLYVYHPFFRDLSEFEARRIGWSPIENVWVSTAVSATLTLMVAAASWRFLEAPINGLKRFFELPDHSERVGGLALIETIAHRGSPE